MQLARNMWPDYISGRDKSLRRKLLEAKLARKIERRYSKDKVLELYLNQIPLGDGAYGVEAASPAVFRKIRPRSQRRRGRDARRDSEGADPVQSPPLS